MTWDPTPWFVGGGAQHSPEVARLLAFASTGGAEGIVEPSDLKVVPLNVPGGKVRALPGAALIRNRTAGYAQQTYAARNPSEDVVDIVATGSSGGRSDLIVARIEDGTISGQGWQPPADPKVGPYVFTRVISNVPAGTTRLQDVNGYSGHSAVTLARVDLPASTGTVTAAMITDLRKLARPRTLTETFSNQGGTASTLQSETFVAWPPFAPGIVVPDWATHAQLETSMAGILAVGNVDGETRLDLELTNGTKVLTGSVLKYDLDVGSTGGNGQRLTLLGATYGNVVNARGQSVVIKPYAHKLPNRPDRGPITADSSTQMLYRITFYERTT